jgi:hypothetical protein
MSIEQDRALLDRTKRIFRYVYLRLVRVADDPVHVALGFALGVFIGVFPTFGIGIPPDPHNKPFGLVHVPFAGNRQGYSCE